MAFPGKQVGHVVEIRAERIRPLEGQPREFFDDEALRRLERSIRAAGQQNPGIVTLITDDPAHEYQLVDGQRRWLCCKHLQLPMRVIIRDDLVDGDSIFLSSIISNFSREDHTPMEIAKAIKRIRESKKYKKLPRAEQNAAIADLFGHSVAWLLGYEALMRLHPKIQNLLDPRLQEKGQGVSYRVAVNLAELHPDRQIEVVKDLIGKEMNREQALQYVRRLAGTEGVNVSGKKVTMQDHRRLMTAMGSLLKQMRDTGIDYISVFRKRDSTERRIVVERIRQLQSELEKIELGILAEQQTAKVQPEDAADRAACDAERPRPAKAPAKVDPKSSLPAGSKPAWSDKAGRMVMRAPDGTEYVPGAGKNADWTPRHSGVTF